MKYHETQDYSFLVRRQIVAKENIKILLIVLVNLQQINSSNARYSY